MTKYQISDDHEWADEQRDREAREYDPTSLESHTVDVVLTTDQDERYGYGRERYTVHVGHDEDNAPYVVYAVEHTWKGNYWRETREWDWRDIPGSVRQRATSVVAGADSPADLDSGYRLIDEGGRPTWRRRDEDDAGVACPLKNCNITGPTADEVREHVSETHGETVAEMIDSLIGSGDDE